MLKKLAANTGMVSKFLVAAAGVVITGLATHDWTGTANVISDAVALLVYLIPNSSSTTTPSAQ